MQNDNEDDDKLVEDILLAKAPILNRSAVRSPWVSVAALLLFVFAVYMWLSQID